MVATSKKYIVATSLKSGTTNKLCYCRACFNKLGSKNHPVLKTIGDKTDGILKHFKTIKIFKNHIVNKKKMKF